MDDSKVDIEIIQVDNPWKFLAREKTECAKSPQAKEFQEVYTEMNEYCQQLTDEGMTYYRPCVGEICAALSREEGLWHRVKIESMATSSHGKQVCCYMIDKGIQQTFPLSRLVKLTKRFQEVPGQVHQCCLWGVQPLSLEIVEADTGLNVVDRPGKKWDPAAIDYMQKMVDESQGSQAEIVHRDSENTHYLRLYFTTRNQTVCFNDVLADENYATKINISAAEYERLTKSSCSRVEHDFLTPVTLPSTSHWSQSGPVDMPDLIPYDCTYESHKHSLPEMKTSDTERSSRHKGCVRDKQEMSAACLQPNVDCSFTVRNTTECRMNDSTTQPQSAVYNPGTDLSSKIRACRFDNHQYNGDSSQVSDKDSKSLPFGNNKSSLMCSKLFRAASKASDSFINIGCGRGRGFILPKDGDLIPQGFPPGSLQKKNNGSSLSTDVPTCADDVQMPPLVAYTHSTASEHGLSPSTVNPLRNGSALDRSDATDQRQPKVQSSSAITLPRHPNSLASSDGSPVARDQRQQKVQSSSTVTLPRNPHRLAPSDGSRLRNSRSRGMNRQLETEVQDVPITPQHPNIPMLTRQDQPIPRPFLGVVVHGKSVPSPICDVRDVPFKESVKTALEKMDIKSAKSIQAYVWPAVLNCRHIVGICPPQLGKTMSYVAGVLSLLLDEVEYIGLPSGKGPRALVIVPSWKNARNVYEMVESFNSPDNSKKIKSHILYAGGTEDSERNQVSLLQGCDILISTPHSLIRMLDQDITSLKRLCHIILDDADVLAARFPKEVDTVMQRYMLHLKDRRLQKKCLDLPQQILIFACCWTKGIEDFYLRYTQEAVIAISSRVEASVYGGVRQVVKLTKPEQKLAGFCNLLDSLSSTTHRVAVFAQDTQEAEQLYQAAKSRTVYCLLIHEDLTSQMIEETRTQWVHSSQSPQLMVMVCTDQCYHDLDITNATMVVHYGLPDSKTKFGNRLACMLDYFMDRTSSTKPEIEPVSQVIVTSTCAARAQSLYDILQRCPAEYSLQLQQFLTGYRMVMETSERKVLCPFFKSFGACNVQKKCTYRHVMIPDQDLKTGDTAQNTLPSSGEVKIKIIHVENASRYYCHLLEHRSVPDNVRTDLRLVYQRLVMEMVTFFSKESNHVPYIPSDDLFADGICAFKDNDSIFHRAKVLTKRNGSVTSATEYRLWLVDASQHKTATVDQLLKLPKSLAHIPYQAVEAYLCCVKPMDDDVEWTVEADTMINDLVLGKELIGRIMLRVGLTVWLMPLVHQVSLKSVGLTNDINVRQELLANKFAVANADHMQNLFEFFRGKIEISEKLMRQYFDYTLEMEMRQESLSELDKFHEVSIAAVISPDLFYVHKWENFDQLEALEARIAEVVKSKVEDSSGLEQHKADMDMQLEKGSVCLALSSDDRWYRAKIVSELVSGKWPVFFLDYGDREKIAKSNVRPLPRELAELPCQAIECQLAYVQPADSNWDRLAADVMCDLAYFVNEDKKKLFAQVVSKVDACYGIGQKLVVDLWDSDVRFSQEVVWSCKARCTVEHAGIEGLVGKPAMRKLLLFNKWDKIPYLCANIYWSEVQSDAVEQATELHKLLSCRDEGWDSDLLQRETLSSAFKVVGYIQDSEAHGILVDSLVTCCLDSDRVAKLALSEDFLSSLAACLEQASRPVVQHQAAKAVSQLVSQESILNSHNCSYLVSVFSQFLSRPPSSSINLETLKYVCCAAAKIVQMTDENMCDELKSSVMVEQIFASLRQTSADVERAPWLEMLAAVATWDSCHTCLMREANIADIMNLLSECSCEKCLYYLMSVCGCLVKGSRKHKVVLLENQLMAILKGLEAGGLSSPVSEVCRQLKEELALTLPQPEQLAGVPAYCHQEVSKTVSPHVTWSQNRFRILLKIQVRSAQVEDFMISDSRISCRSESDGVINQFDWELYDFIVPEHCKVCVFACDSLVSLWKRTTGKWSRLLKQKVKLPNLRPDFEHPYDSDDEEDVEDEDNIARLTQRRNLLCQEEMWKVKTTKTFESSDESSDDLAVDSDSSDEDPAWDMASIMANITKHSS